MITSVFSVGFVPLEESKFDIICMPWSIVKATSEEIIILALAYILPAIGAYNKRWSWKVCLLPTVFSALYMVYNRMNRNWCVEEEKAHCEKYFTKLEKNVAAYIAEGEKLGVSVEDLKVYRDNQVASFIQTGREKIKEAFEPFSQTKLNDIQQFIRSEFPNELRDLIYPIQEAITHDIEHKQASFLEKIEQFSRLEELYGAFSDCFAYSDITCFNLLKQWDRKLKEAEGKSRFLNLWLNAKGKPLSDKDQLEKRERIANSTVEFNRLVAELSDLRGDEKFNEQVKSLWQTEIDLYIEDIKLVERYIGKSDLLNSKCTQLQGFRGEVTIKNRKSLAQICKDTHGLLDICIDAHNRGKAITSSNINLLMGNDFRRGISVRSNPAFQKVTGRTYSFYLRKNQLSVGFGNGRSGFYTSVTM